MIKTAVASGKLELPENITKGSISTLSKEAILMQGNELGLFCNILLKIWKTGDMYSGRYLKEAGLFEADETESRYDKARSKLKEYGSIENLEKYGIDGITVEDGIVPLENSMEGVVLPDGFLFAVPYLYTPYILVTEEFKPIKIKMNNE